jgi:Na+/H+ antiporter NhaC
VIKILKITGSVILFSALCALAAWGASSYVENASTLLWYSVVPPLLAIFLAFMTRRVMLSLGLAVLVGALLVHVPSAPSDAHAWGAGLKTSVSFVTDAVTNTDNIKIIIFVPPIFAMIALIVASGGFIALIQKFLPWVKGRKSAQAATALMGLIYFIDDYSNTMIVGSAMRPVTDKFRVSREKLAFLVDATSAPIAGLAIISTWIAYEVGLFTAVGQELGIAKDGYAMFFDALSFRFYCLFMIIFVFVHILFGRDFGPMKTAEKRRLTESIPPETEMPLKTSDSTPASASQRPPRAINALLPLGGLILFHLVGLWIDGGGPEKLSQNQSPLNWHYWREVISNAENSILILDFAAFSGLGLALICVLLFNRMSWSTIGRCLFQGLTRSILPCLILVFAWSLKNCCISLKTGDFLAALLADNLSPYWFAPLVFLIASITSFATGTSWGTMAILIPTAIPVAFALDGDTYGLTTMISLGAVLDGAIFGDHCSPISDTTIISSISSQCDLMQHVRTQLPYSLFVAALALTCGYLPSALGLRWGWCLLLALGAMLAFFFVLTRYQRHR